jgi:hypothetical protein
MPSSLDMRFIIISLAPHQNKISSITCCILIGCIQLYDGSYSCSSSSITIISCPTTSSLGSAALTKGLDNFSIMMSAGVGAL